LLQLLEINIELDVFIPLRIRDKPHYLK
jgi:hypothetical protein